MAGSRHSEYQPNTFVLWKPTRRTKILGFIIGGLFGLLSFGRPDNYGWMGTSLMAAAALSIPMLQFRQLWSQARFWITTSLLTAMQLPLVVLMRPLVERLRPLFLLDFGIADGLFIIFVISSVCLVRGTKRQ